VPCWAGGDFGPLGRERARVGALAAQLAQQRGGDGGGRRCGTRPTCQRGGGFNGANDNGGRGRVDWSPTGSGNPQRFSIVGPVPWWGGGVAARAGVGDHRSGVNLTDGGLWWPVHVAVAGVHGGEVAGAVAGCNRRGKGVPCDRE
jgi:hypothetical protein